MGGLFIYGSPGNDHPSTRFSAGTPHARLKHDLPTVLRWAYLEGAEARRIEDRGPLAWRRERVDMS